jgi:outer membrane protein assembly factor BamD
MTAVLGLALTLASCSGGSGGSVTYLDTARANYEKGMSELKDESWAEAQKYFTYVKNKFPFSSYATLAELRVGDAYYGQDKWLEAIDAYRQFIKFHPLHAEVTNGYASLRICQAFVEQIPTDWVLIPPSHEKDQGATKDALRELTSFIRTFPESTHLPKVHGLYRKCMRKLADHELYVARFYLNRDKPRATILRLETLLKKYPDVQVDPEVMLLLGQTYLKMEQKQKARETFAALVQKYPNDAHSAKARLYLKFMAGQRE